MENSNMELDAILGVAQGLDKVSKSKNRSCEDFYKAFKRSVFYEVSFSDWDGFCCVREPKGKTMTLPEVYGILQHYGRCELYRDMCMLPYLRKRGVADCSMFSWFKSAMSMLDALGYDSYWLYDYFLPLMEFYFLKWNPPFEEVYRIVGNRAKNVLDIDESAEIIFKNYYTPERSV